MSQMRVGRYEIERELGRGGMAVAYLAQDPYMKREVVVKLMSGHLTSDPEFTKRFQQEAQVIARLEHPNIVPVYDFGYHDDEPFIVMRYMTGGTLANQIESKHAYSTADVAHVMERICAALDEVHNRGVVHRDLKPANVLLDQQAEAFLADFGLVKIVGSSGQLSGRFMIGTPAYMAPEQVYGNAPVDLRADVYALGVMLYEMFVGRVPYWDTEIPRLLMKHVMEPIPHIREVRSDLPQSIDDLITVAMAKDPKDRYQTAGEFSEALTAATSGIPSRRARRRLTASTMDSLLDSLDKDDQGT
jgi:serine/threonine-protein kinase